jgi:serine/threonine-protein kinase
MTPVQSPSRILADLRRLNLLPGVSPLWVEAALSSETPPPDQLARTLVDAGLTPFQVESVLAGKAERLVFGPYVLLDQLGAGGMGVVYKARHVKLGRVDALKVLRTDKVGSRTVAQRFLREIQLTSSLSHAHIVRAYDAGVVGRQLWLATEFVDGTDLGTIVLARGPLSVPDACLAVYQTALALRHIHERGLVHRDLKPSNLIRDNATGAVKLLDLGLSGFHRSEPVRGTGGTLTRDGVLLGTPDFMAPEQVENAHRVDIRADLYSLGCSFYFLLTGKPPFDGTQVETLIKHGMAPPPALVLPTGPTPVALAAVVARLMAKRPEDRFPDPQSLIDALLALRPGADDVMEHTAAMIAVTPLPQSTSSSGAFAHLLSSDELAAPALSQLRATRPAGGGWVGWTLGGLAVVFLAGLVIAALRAARLW